MSDSEGTETEELQHLKPTRLAAEPAMITKRALTIDGLSSTPDHLPALAKKPPSTSTSSVTTKQDPEVPAPKASKSKATTAKKTEKKRDKSSKRTFQTLLTATKLHHLKKKDGEPFWRVDIQYEFLRAIFYNDQEVFTNAYDGTSGHTFADIYIDAMTRSSKCSKVLREKMLSDKEGTLNMAMVCLLVNVGRMNTTLNFFPEMRAQLRTYHPIPCLQQGEEPKLGTNDYNKQLQDAPRLKSILKGACEDRPEPGTIDNMKEVDKIPHTNPINLVFLMSTFSYQVEKMFFSQTFRNTGSMSQKYEFFDLIIKKELSSASRARAFLWLCWSFLETNLTDDELRKNPFGYGLEDGTKVPELVALSKEQEAAENVDPPDEVRFGKEMSRLRHKYLEDIGELHLFASPSDGTPKSESVAGTQGGNADSAAPPLLKRRQLRVRVAQDYSEVKEEGAEPTKTSRTSSGTKAKAPAVKVPKVKGRGRQRRSREEEKREEKINAEADHIIRRKHTRRRLRRYKNGPVKHCWSQIKLHDPFEASDDEKASKKRKLSESNGSAETSSFSQDWGEEASDNLRAIRRALRWRQRWLPVSTTTTTTITTSSTPAPVAPRSDTPRPIIKIANSGNKMGLANLLV